MLNRIYKIYFALGLVALPLLTFAQQLGKTRTLLESAQYIVTNILIPLAFTLALLLFFWGMVKYIWSAGDKEEGKKIMVWGVVALFVMSSIWGIVSFLQGEIWGDVGPIQMEIPTIAQ